MKKKTSAQNTKEQDKKFSSRAFRVWIPALVMILCLVFFAYLYVSANTYSTDVDAQAKTRAELYLDETANLVSENFEDILTKAKVVAKEISYDFTESQILEKISAISDVYKQDENFIDILFKTPSGELYDEDGKSVKASEELKSLYTSSDGRISEVFQYGNQVRAIAASATVTGNNLADKVFLVYYTNIINFPDSEIISQENSDPKYNGLKMSEFSLLCKKEGFIISRVENSENIKIDKNNVFETEDGVLKTYITDQTEYDNALNAINSGVDYSKIVRVGYDNYVLAIKSFGPTRGRIFILSLYKTSKIYGDGYKLVNSIWSTVMGLSVVLIVFGFSLILTKVANAKRLYKLEMVDLEIGCSTQVKFEKDVKEILERNKASSFCIVTLQVNNLGYVVETFGEICATDLSKYIKSSCKNILLLSETMGYAKNKEFLLFLQYKDVDDVVARLSGLFLSISHFDGFSDDTFRVSINYNVYKIDREKEQTVSQMIEKARMAKNSKALNKGQFTIHFYEDLKKENYLQKLEIESRMESALKNNEFHLFYQPKYNIARNDIDGSEILVRWYDKKIDSYRRPDEFIPVFEENGFISKLDRYMFFMACKHLADRVEKRLIVYPVSVNVSRVTAMQSGFVDYYKKIKEKFNIKDFFITLEFTESFAYENTDYLSSMMSELHHAGFKCSIDDFGTGYSSYSVLKMTDIDEIKLDKFFLKKGPSAERDEILLKSVIDMIKDMGVTCTQEGAETEEDFTRLKNLKCDVIQGYFYSKPLKYTDYCQFIEQNYQRVMHK